jgi:putative transposase
VRQCALLGVSRSSFYYEPAVETAENLALMRQIDEQYMETPFYGSRRIAACFKRGGDGVNRKRIQRLMRLMGLEAVYQKPRTTLPNPQHKKYPYLLRGLVIDRVDQVWSTDITYIPMRRGFLYLVAVLDWHSRYVLSWELSNTLDGSFCITALETALEKGTPEFFNTDQGAQFTSTHFTGRLEGKGIKVSMDGRGRALDNVFVERLWRTVKYEDVYVKDYDDGREAAEGIGVYFEFYNDHRPHQSLKYMTPGEVYCAKRG